MSKRNVYKGHRYVPKIMGEWNQEETYEGLSIVTNKGTSYTSKKRVPVGIELLDEEYWVVTGNYNAQVENYRQEVKEFGNRISENTLDINTNKLNIEKKADKKDVEEINQQLLTKADKKDVEEINQQLLTKASQDDLSDVIQEVDSLDQSLSILDKNKKNKGNSIIHAVDVQKNPNETDDQFINRMLRSLPDEQGTVVLDGTYQLKDTILLTPYQSLQGTGHNTNLVMNVNNKDIIRLEHTEHSEYVYGVKILNLSLHGNMTSTGINLKKCTHLRIEDVYVYDTKWGIWADSAWLAQYDRVTVRNYNTMGEAGIHVHAGTSNLYNNCWVKNFKKGYETHSMYTTLNACACDTFTEFAYFLGQATTLNSCGAEDGRLVPDGYVYGAGPRSVVFNACETMDIAYTGSKDQASIFYFGGSLATLNNYSHSGGTPLPNNASFMVLRQASYVNLINTRWGSGHTGTLFNFAKYNDATASSVFEQYGARFTVHRWNGTKNFVTE